MYESIKLNVICYLFFLMFFLSFNHYYIEEEEEEKTQVNTRISLHIERRVSQSLDFMFRSISPE